MNADIPQELPEADDQAARATLAAPPAQAPLIDLARIEPSIEQATRARYHGEVTRVSGFLVEARGLPAGIGDLCRIERQRPRQPGVEDCTLAEVVGFSEGHTLLMPHGDAEGIAPSQRVLAVGRKLRNADKETGQ